MKLVFVLWTLLYFTALSCTPKITLKFLVAETVKCQIPVRVVQGDEEKVEDVAVQIELGFESPEQKKNWVGKGFPVARLVHGKQIAKIPVQGLAGNQILPLKTKISGGVCEGSIAVMDTLQRAWFIFGQGDANKLVFMAYDLKEKKIVDGHAPPRKIFGLNYNQGKLFYMTATTPDTPTQVFVKKAGKEVPLKEFTLPFWVRLDLAGQQKAAVDNLKTYSSSAFRTFFKNIDEFNRFFDLSKGGTYQKPWAYLANIGAETCIAATTERARGELPQSHLFCRQTQNKPARTN